MEAASYSQRDNPYYLSMKTMAKLVDLMDVKCQTWLTPDADGKLPRMSKLSALENLILFYSLTEWRVRHDLKKFDSETIKYGTIASVFDKHSGGTLVDTSFYVYKDRTMYLRSSMSRQIAKQLSEVRATLCHSFGLYRTSLAINLDDDFDTYITQWWVILKQWIDEKCVINYDECLYAKLLHISLERLKGVR